MIDSNSTSSSELDNMREGSNLLKDAKPPEEGKLSGKAWGRVGKVATQGHTYPHGVFFILGNEFCERFSYYGMRAILVIYLTSWLNFSGDTATAFYHGFVVLCYLTPLLGALLADGFLGKYKVILYLSVIYAVGNIIMAFTAMPPPYWLGPIIGLVLIGIGTGGIKPCVSAFGGDQFAPEQSKELERFFSVFYFVINLGSLISMLVTPVLRAHIHCYDTSCYPVAFGLPACLMILSVVLFYSGRSLYKNVTPTGNVLTLMFKCIWCALRKRWSSMEKRSHWLDYADTQFEAQFIADIKAILKVFLLFIPLPVFWALFDQQGSRWTLQAINLDGHLAGDWYLQPDQMQALNPILIIICIPIFESFVYPVMRKCGLNSTCIQRMCVGMLFAAASFAVAGILQIQIQNVSTKGLLDGQSGMRFVNVLPCPVKLQSAFLNRTLAVSEITPHMHIYYQDGDLYPVTVTAHHDCAVRGSQQMTLNPVLEPMRSSLLVLTADAQGQLMNRQFAQPVTKPSDGNAMINLIYTTDVDTDTMAQFVLEAAAFNGLTRHNFSLEALQATAFQEISPGSYSVVIGRNHTTFVPVPGHLQLLAGGVYTIIIQQQDHTLKMLQLVDVDPNSISMFYQVPQYVLITVGEILFSISGLTFVYAQAPKSMKTVLSAAWLMTVAIGNLVDVIVMGSRWIPRQDIEFFVFAVLMVVTAAVFGIMGYFYHGTDANAQMDNGQTDETALVGSGDEPSSQYGTPEHTGPVGGLSIHEAGPGGGNDS